MRSAVLGASLLGLGLLATGCGPTTAASDEVVAALRDDVSGTSTSVLLPTGEVTVTVGDPVAEVEAGETRDNEARQAPEGSSLLPVRLEHDLDAAPWGGLLAGIPQEAPVTLVVDGEERDLGSAYLADGTAIATNPETTFYVVVPGTPQVEDLTVEVGYDGATQTAGFTGDEPEGEASAVSTLSAERPPAADCAGDAWLSRPTAEARLVCEVPLAARTPYWPGSGWSTDDEGWLVVAVRRLEVTGITDPAGDDYEVEQVAGGGSLADLSDAGSAAPLSGTLVLDDTGSSVPLELDVTASPTDGTGSRSFRLSYDLPVTGS